MSKQICLPIQKLLFYENIQICFDTHFISIVLYLVYHRRSVSYWEKIHLVIQLILKEQLFLTKSIVVWCPWTHLASSSRLNALLKKEGWRFYRKGKHNRNFVNSLSFLNIRKYFLNYVLWSPSRKGNSNFELGTAICYVIVENYFLTIIKHIAVPSSKLEFPFL